MNFESMPNEIVEPKPKDEYDTLSTLFLVERLDENFDQVIEQLETLRTLAEKTAKLQEEAQTDPDMIHYIEEYKNEFNAKVEHFEINKKTINLKKLSQGLSPKEIYNDIVLEVNDYAGSQMIGSKPDYIQTL